MKKLVERLKLVKRRIRLLEHKVEEKKKKKKWIQSVVKKAEKKGTRGAFREWCLSQGFTGVNKSCIAFAKKKARETGDTKLLRRAVAAENMLKASGVIE